MMIACMSLNAQSFWYFRKDNGDVEIRCHNRQTVTWKNFNGQSYWPNGVKMETSPTHKEMLDLFQVGWYPGVLAKAVETENGYVKSYIFYSEMTNSNVIFDIYGTPTAFWSYEQKQFLKFKD